MFLFFAVIAAALAIAVLIGGDVRRLSQLRLRHLELLLAAFAVKISVGLLGTIEYYRRGEVNVPYAAVIAAGLFVGALIGAKLAGSIPDLTLRRMFGVFLLLVSLRLLAGR